MLNRSSTLAIFAILAIGATAIYLWHKNELGLAQAQERVKAQDALIQQANDKISESEKRRAQAIADLEAARSKPATIQTVIKYLPATLPAGSEVKIEKLPDAPAPQIVLTGDAQANLQALVNLELAHRECDVNLASCSEKLADAQQIGRALTNDRDEWRKVARGGSKWQRLGKAVKVTLCAGTGAAIGFVAKEKAAGAAIGGAAGAASCEIFF